MENVNRQHQNYTAKIIIDEGTSSPFPARLMGQMFNLRDKLIRDKKKRQAFNNAYNPILDNFMELKTTVKELKEIQDQHLKEVAEGGAVIIHPNRQISVIRPIDTRYRALIKDFFIKGEMIISGIPGVGKEFDIRIGFFFGDANKFKKGVDKLRVAWKELCEPVIQDLEYARSTWYKDFNDIRNDIEHKTLKVPPIEYHLDGNAKVSVHFPDFVPNHSVLVTMEHLTDRILELLEDCIVFMFATRLEPGLLIKIIPENERDPANVIKYKLCMRIGNQVVPVG